MYIINIYMSDRKWAPLVPAPLIYSKVPARQFYVPYNGKTYQICSKCDYPSSNPEKRCEWCEIGIKNWNVIQQNLRLWSKWPLIKGGKHLGMPLGHCNYPITLF
jgi:hypothetical protein